MRGNKPVAIFSLEMSGESLLLRLLSSDAQIDSHKFRTGHLSREDGGKIPVSLSRLAEALSGSTIADPPRVVEMGARNLRRHQKRDKGPRSLVVDYLRLVSGRGRFGNRNEEVSSIAMRGLKRIGKGTQSPRSGVLSPAHARANEREDRRPQLSDLRGIRRHRTGCRCRDDVHSPAECV